MVFHLNDINYRTVADSKGFLEESDARMTSQVALRPWTRSWTTRRTQPDRAALRSLRLRQEPRP